MNKKILSKYVQIIDESAYVALYNYLNGKLLIAVEPMDISLLKHFISYGEILDDKLTRILEEYEMLVYSQYEEYTMVDYILKSNYRKNATLEITIIPGQVCNFRCKYCYEASDCSTVSVDIIAGIKNFIINMTEQYNYKNIIISWFGGEPTLYSDLVIDFMSSLRSILPDIIINGNMTTNGYLLNNDLFNKFLECGIDTYQITLDCFKEEHDKLRILKSGEGTWQQIHQNLINMCESNKQFTVLLRINFNEYMAESIFPFLDYIKQRFDNRFIVHIHSIFNGDENSPFTMSMCDPYIEINMKIAMFKYMIDNNIINDVPLHLLAFGGQICYAASPNSYIIDQNGNIRKCTVALDADYNLVGKIIDKENYILNFYQLSTWTEWNRMDKCKDCIIYPTCCASQGCPKARIKGEGSIGCDKEIILAKTYIKLLCDKIATMKLADLVNKTKAE